MSIQYLEPQLQKVFSDLDGNKLVLPNFQRGFVWSTEKQKKLLASVLVNLPIGSLLILDGEAGDFMKRKLCYPTELNIDHDCAYVLDGQQRLSTLRTIFYDVYSGGDWIDVWDGLFGNLRNRWFVKVRPKKSLGENDYFGIDTLHFDTIHNLTDSDLMDFIVHKRIYKTKTKESHHPAYVPLDSIGDPIQSPAQAINAIAEAFASEYLVPLWEIGLGNKGIHWRVAQKIADIRVAELKVEAEEAGHTVDFYERIFSHGSVSRDEIEDELAEHLLDGQLSNIAFSTQWAALSADWKTKVCTEFQKVIDSKVSTIQLDRGEVNRAVAIFEAINRGGEPLSVYDLIVAKSAKDQGVKNLSSRIIDFVNTPLEVPIELSAKFHQDQGAAGVALWQPSSMQVVSGNEPSSNLKEWFVNVLSLIVYADERGEVCKVNQIKKEKILELKTSEVNECFQLSITAVVRALAFLQIRCGAIVANDVSYKLMLVVLAFHLRNDRVWNSKLALDKLEYWYWVSLLGGKYYTSQTVSCIEDIKDVLSLIEGDRNKYRSRLQNVFDCQDYVTKDILLRRDPDTESEQRSVSRAVMQYVMSKCPPDFLETSANQDPANLYAWRVSGNSDLVEEHHIIPLGNATKVGQSTKELRGASKHILNSSLNKVYISKEANRLIRDKTPGEYLQMLSQVALATHMLPAVDKFQEAFKKGEYEELLEDRFDKLQASVLQHLNSLV